MRYDAETCTLTVTEYEAHDIIACLNGFTGQPFPAQEDMVAHIIVEPVDPEEFGPELVAKWNSKFATLLELLGHMDAEFHDDAEHTCM